MQDDAPLTIGRLARAAGVGIQTVRFYERRGLLAQPRRDGTGYRRYTADHLTRLRFIRKAQHLGFSLREVHALLGMSDASGARCANVKHEADRKVEEVTARIRDLQRMKRSLEALSRACGAGRRAMRRCRILSCFEEGSPCGDSQPKTKGGAP